MDNTEGKVTCTAEYTYENGKYSNSIYYDNNNYNNFYMVEHEPAAANAIFRSINESNFAGFADCFPPVIARTKLVLAHRVTGTTLEKWLKQSSDLVYKDSNGNAIRMTDKLKLVIQDLGFIVLHGIRPGLQIHLTKETIFVSNCQPPRVLGVAASANRGEANTDLENFTSLVQYIWTECNFTDMKERDLITHSLRPNRLYIEYHNFLYSPTFWRKEVRLYVIIRLGEIVSCVKNITCSQLEHSQNVLGWRTLFSSDPKLQNLVGQAPKNKNQGYDVAMYNAVEVDCGIRFLANTLAHFERMCKTQTNLGSPIELIEYYDLHYSDMMNELYRVIGKLDRTFRSNP